MSKFETLLVQTQGNATVVTINRPEVMNALNEHVISDLTHVLEDIASDKTTRGVVLTGAGDKAFVAGADISSMVEMSENDALRFASQGHAVGDLIARLDVPVIAAVDGFALGGGCEMALACDFIYASSKAMFGQPEVKLGVLPGFGGTQRLLRRIGAAATIELCLTGAMIEADEALRLRLINRVVSEGDVVEAALATIEKIARMGPLAVAATKRVIHEGAEIPLSAGCQLEIEAFASMFNSADQTEGMKAFLAKRRADFKGQ